MIRVDQVVISGNSALISMWLLSDYDSCLIPVLWCLCAKPSCHGCASVPNRSVQTNPLSEWEQNSLHEYFLEPCVCVSQWRLLRGGQLIIMSGMALMEWHQTHGNHVFDVFDTIPLILLQPLPWASPPQLRCHQPPVVCVCLYLLLSKHNPSLHTDLLHQISSITVLHHYVQVSALCFRQDKRINITHKQARTHVCTHTHTHRHIDWIQTLKWFEKGDNIWMLHLCKQHDFLFGCFLFHRWHLWMTLQQ